MDVRLKARAKINITLDVIGKRQDGYHDLRMIMQTVDLHDSIYIKKIDKPKIKIITNLPWLPVNENNLIYRAAEMMKEEFKIPGGFFINLTKIIPVSAGLAGGSADCAATLVGIRNICRLPIGNEDLMKIGKKLGADVPFCIMRGTALAEGIGERLTPLPSHPRAYVLLAKPPVNISTQSVFKAFNIGAVVKRPNTGKAIECLERGDLDGIAKELCNTLESVTCRKHGIINELKAAMLEAGALGALMSGSGPTVFGYFADKSDGLIAMQKIKREFSTVKEVFLTRIFN